MFSLSSTYRFLGILYCVCFYVLGYSQSSHHYLDYQSLENGVIYNIKDLNSGGLEFSPSFYKDGLVFVHAYSEQELYDKNIKESFFDLGYYNLSKHKVENYHFGNSDQELFHLGPVSFNKGQDVMYYSKMNVEKSKEDGRNHMRIVRSVLENEQWIEVDDWPFNHEKYSYTHPSISDNEKLMIFASNMPGGYGKMDLYYCKKINGTWSAPRNMGPLINTIENDWFPFLYQNKYLFFASEGHEGYGGLDVYYSGFDGSGWSFPENVGLPVNSASDDLGMIISRDALQVYFTSAREGGQGKDDIYQLSLSSSLFKKDEISLPISYRNQKFRVYDRISHRALSNTELIFTPINMDQSNYALNTEYGIELLTQEESGVFTLKVEPHKLANDGSLYGQTDYFGRVSLDLNQAAKYLLTVSKDNYTSTSTIIDGNNDIPEIVILMDAVGGSYTPSQGGFSIPVNRGDMVVFENILYELNKSEIKEGAARELDELAKVMHANPNMIVQLMAHTDVQGNQTHNQKLSNRRAESAKAYLVKKGINSERILAFGLGESFPRNHCVEGVECTDEEHAYNRRTEVKILEN